MLSNSENVARAIFSPKMIRNGLLLNATFQLRSSIQEDYVSVMRTSIASWLDEVKSIPQNVNRKLYGYANMNVGEIHSIDIESVEYKVEEKPTERMKSHAGIYVWVNGEILVGGKPISKLPNGCEEESFLLLAIRSELVNIAQKGLVEIDNQTN